MIDEDYKTGILKTIQDSGIPIQFWQDVRSNYKQGYNDVFSSVSSDPNLVESQRIQKLHQERYFRSEHILMSLAKKHKLKYTDTLLADNKFNSNVYVATKSVGITQSYVKRIGDLPNPATYWKNLAEKTGLPRLNLGDEPEDVLNIKDVYGLITHNPIGSNFTEESQKLGMIQFCVPSADGEIWNAELTIQEIISAYANAVSDSVEPIIKPILKQGLK